MFVLQVIDPSCKNTETKYPTPISHSYSLRLAEPQMLYVNALVCAQHTDNFSYFLLGPVTIVQVKAELVFFFWSEEEV